MGWLTIAQYGIDRCLEAVCPLPRRLLVVGSPKNVCDIRFCTHSNFGEVG
jgi:hypothetical protein